mmetsp:Transcript_5421/g.16485  ORF Transcript_5421/g.16485 Transcript_5421/m.16485 type:complete len:228 (-) Transcript_5421:554-1237(-)
MAATAHMPSGTVASVSTLSLVLRVSGVPRQPVRSACEKTKSASSMRRERFSSSTARPHSAPLSVPCIASAPRPPTTRALPPILEMPSTAPHPMAQKEPRKSAERAEPTATSFPAFCAHAAGSLTISDRRSTTAGTAYTGRYMRSERRIAVGQYSARKRSELFCGALCITRASAPRCRHASTRSGATPGGSAALKRACRPSSSLRPLSTVASASSCSRETPPMRMMKR